MILNCLKHDMLYQLSITALMFASLEGETKSDNLSAMSSSMRPTTLVSKTSGNTTTEYPKVCCFYLCYTVNAFLSMMNNIKYSDKEEIIIIPLLFAFSDIINCEFPTIFHFCLNIHVPSIVLNYYSPVYSSHYDKYSKF